MRGRGGGRGRGRGRGGRGRRETGRGGGRGGYTPRAQSATNSDDKTTPSKTLNINEDVSAFFTGSVSVDQHIAGQEENRERYAAGMAVLEKNGVEIADNARVRALVAAWARHDHDLAEAFLNDHDNFGLVEILKALTVLDAGRCVRVMEKRMKRLHLSTSKVLPKTIGKIKSDIDNLNHIKPSRGSASGAVCKHIRRWVQKFTKEDLEFYALHYPTAPWRKLADICHFHPQKDFASLPWFLPFCFGEDAPEGTMVSRCREVTQDNVNSLIKEFPVPYTHVKDHKDSLVVESKARIASYELKLDTVLWYYEDLQCTEVDEVIMQRIKSGEKINLANGKLIERLLTLKMLRENIPQRNYYQSRTTTQNKTALTKAGFLTELIPVAESRLKTISLSLEAPVVVIGDASGSMDVAIRTSSIIAGLLTAITSAKLVFFNTENRAAPYLPKSISEVLELAVTTEASGGTAPAASLFPFYAAREVVKTFIIVTDEEENTSYENYRFATLYKKYHDEVYPARLVFVSFLSNQHARGDMVSKLESYNFSPLQFKLDGNRPDLTKLDKLFGLLSAESATFNQEVVQIESEIKTNGLDSVFSSLKVT